MRGDGGAHFDGRINSGQGGGGRKKALHQKERGWGTKVGDTAEFDGCRKAFFARVGTRISNVIHPCWPGVTGDLGALEVR